MTTPIESPHGHSAPLHAAESTQYTRIAMVLHWVIAVLIICNAVLGLTAESFPDSWIRPVVDTHKSIGITVLGLVLLRILWRGLHLAAAVAEGVSQMGAHGRSHRTLCAVSADDRLAVIRLAARLGMERRRDASDASVRRDSVAACGFCDEPRSGAEGVAARSFRRIAYVARLRAVRAFSDARGWRAQGSAGQQEVGDLADGAVMDVKLHVLPTRPKKTPPQPDPLVKRTLEEA